MQVKHWSLFQAMGYVKSKRSVIFPNPGFQRQLLDFEKKLINHRKNTKAITDSCSKTTPTHKNLTSPKSFLKSSSNVEGLT